ncbi:hypothetical protein EPR50_G00244660 [Perca flavescens]|uniref:Uncharacterized protein n=1 Tax=Perca flavescens TaxID=8167 RepID=A0A484BYI1_PERFV|nr:CST complex subunit CTC1-like [Perca flavescens]TDG95846.1 hypothetical protein EPR50_G00244660 [Perca flavescens]
MDSLQLFLDQMEPSGDAESVWLKEIFSFVSEHLCPVLSGPAPSAADGLLTGGDVCADQLSVCLVKKIQEHTTLTHTLPVSYRLVSVSELLSRQRVASSATSPGAPISSGVGQGGGA